MKKRLSVVIWILAVTLPALLVSCSKLDSLTASPKTTLQRAVREWYDAYSPKASVNYKKTADDIMAGLNFNDAAIVEPPHRAPVFLIRTATIGNTPEYFAFSKHDEEYQAMGIFHARSLRDVRNFLMTATLPPGDSLTLYSFSQRPQASWLTTPNGQSIYKMVRSEKEVPELVDKTGTKTGSSAAPSNMSTGSRPSNFNIAAGCTAWYYIGYDATSGRVVSVDYLYTTCNETDELVKEGGNPALASDLETDCLRQVDQSISAGHVESSSLGADNNGDDGITRIRTYHWKIYSGLGWHLISHEKGVHSYSRKDNQWHWVSLTHVSISVVGRWAGGDITPVLNTAAEYVRYESPVAGMELNFNIRYGFLCSGKPLDRSKDENASAFFNINAIVNET